MLVDRLRNAGTPAGKWRSQDGHSQLNRCSDEADRRLTPDPEGSRHIRPPGFPKPHSPRRAGAVRLCVEVGQLDSMETMACGDGAVHLAEGRL